MTKPLISVCIPVYNGEKYLKTCLDSVISQTFLNYEVIICDDGSKDGSISIAEEYAGKHSSIKFFKNDRNLGLVGNWNRCVELANGSWIKFLFQDDLMNANCLEEMAKHTDADVELMVCKRNFLIEGEPDADEKDYYEKRVRTLENTGHYMGNNFSAEIISKIAADHPSLNFIGEPSLTMFRKISLVKVGGFDRELRQICDLEFLLRIASVYGLRYIPLQLCIFRIHDSSTTSRNTSGDNYYNMKIEALLYALKLLTKTEFNNFRSYVEGSGLSKLKLFVKYRAYKACRAIKTAEDRQIFEELFQSYKPFMYKWYEIPVFRIYMAIK
jgi:glycosyltransferase involved in cell wall biosynthesis